MKQKTRLKSKITHENGNKTSGGRIDLKSKNQNPILETLVQSVSIGGGSLCGPPLEFSDQPNTRNRPSRENATLITMKQMAESSSWL